MPSRARVILGDAHTISTEATGEGFAALLIDALVLRGRRPRGSAKLCWACPFAHRMQLL